MPKKVISTKNAPAAVGPYSQAMLAQKLLFISGQVPIDPASGKLITGSAAEQMRLIMRNVGAILKAAGASYADVVKCTIYTTDLSRFSAINEAYAEFFDRDPPARATVQVEALPLGADVEVELIAYVGE